MNRPKPDGTAQGLLTCIRTSGIEERRRERMTDLFGVTIMAYGSDSNTGRGGYWYGGERLRRIHMKIGGIRALQFGEWKSYAVRLRNAGDIEVC